MTPEQAAALRQPFPEETIGKLPRSTCKDCSDRRAACDRHAWVWNCPLCHSHHSSAAVHLDYVGHAATTDRLLQVDPTWSWEPLSLDERGLPAIDRGNLWIRLTVCGVTRIGVGDGNSLKEMIGDAIRNAAMRFGVALDLWAKEDLAAGRPQTSGAAVADSPQGVGDVDAETTGQPQAMRADGPAPEPVLLNTSSKLAKAMYASITEAGIPEDQRIAHICEVIGRTIASTKEMTEAEARMVLDSLPTQEAS